MYTHKRTFYLRTMDPESLTSSSPNLLRHLLRTRSTTNSPQRSRHTSESEPLQIYVQKASKYLGPPEIPNCYLMFSFPRGHVLLINNERFDERTCNGNNFRRGSEVDASNLETLFKELRFEVEMHRNLTRNQIVHSVRSFAESDIHARADMAVVAILSHGTEGFMYGTDKCAVETEWIIQQLNNENCPNLRGKPKLFILQACRGFCQDYGTPPRMTDLPIPNEVKDSSEKTDIDSEVFNLPPSLKLLSPTVEDILIAYSTIPGYVANRDTVRGSWFIECICKVFMTYSATTDIRDMLDKVSLEMSTYISELGMKQSCSYEVRHFYKKLFFNPGIGPVVNVAQRTNKRSSPNTRPRSISDPLQLQFGECIDFEVLLRNDTEKVEEPKESSTHLSVTPRKSTRNRIRSIGDILD